MTAPDRWHDTDAADLIGTRAERARLFDYLVEATLRRQAISPAKNRIFGIDVRRDMGRFRDALVEAATPAELWYALSCLSNTRHDRHLSLRPVEGGLPLPAETLARMTFGYSELASNAAPLVGVRLATDFSGPAPFLFLAEMAEEAELPAGIAPGDRLVAVNGIEAAAWVERVEPYLCHSTPLFFWYHLPSELVRRTGFLPDSFHRDRLLLAFEGEDGARREVALAYRPASGWTWPQVKAPPYAGWTRLHACATYDLHVDRDARILLLDWHGFGDTLPADVDALMAIAEREGLLGWPIVFDACRSKGGNFGGYILQRLSPRPFRSNFGDLRLSDVTEDVIQTVLAEDREALAAGTLNAEQVAATEWRRDWLETDVRQAQAAGLENTPAVPFKCAHQPKTGDGVLQPAPTHFSGPIVCLTMPFGGSHIDQVVAQMSDNGLCHHIGMPLGGYSKTYVHEETLCLPDSGRPLARFMWSCGNTFRPNGEVLESNPARPHEPFPLTRANYLTHHAEMVRRARAHLLSAASRPLEAAAERAR